MIIKATLGTLILILIVVIVSSYYINKEGFDDITNASAVKSEVSVPVNSSTVATPNAPATTNDTVSVTGATKDVLNPSSVASTAAPIAPVALIVPAPSAIASLKSALGSSMPVTTPTTEATATAGAAKLTPASAANSTVPQRTDVVPEVSVSKCGYDAMALQQKADLLKDIQSVVKNEILANRSVTPVLNSANAPAAKTASVSQGKEYEDSCYKDTEYKCPKNSDGSCPPVPDMAEYIKKDSIPCWGCSVDY